MADGPPEATSATSTRERLVRAAQELFYAEGYERTSLKQVATRASVHGGSLHHFFPRKEDLVVAVLERYREMLDPVLMEPVRAATEDPVERVIGLLGAYREHLVATGFRRGCPIGALGLELANTRPRARALVVENLEEWRRAVQEMLGGPHLGEPELEGLGSYILTVMEGAVLQSRCHGGVEPFDVALRHLGAHLERLRPRLASGAPAS